MTYPSKVERLAAWIVLVIIIVLSISLMRNNIAAAAGNSTAINDTNSSNINLSGLNITSLVSINSTLAVTDSGINKSAQVNNTVKFYANYSSINGTIPSAKCTITSSVFSSQMSFNASLYLYSYQYLFTLPGNYSYTVKCSRDGFLNASKQKTIEIKPIEIHTNNTNTTLNMTDVDKDGYNSSVDCNDNNPAINPGMNEILYNGIDDDCNPSTLDYMIFDISTEKQVYAPGETVKIRVDARNSSDTYLTVNTPSNISYIYILSNFSYPATHEYSLTGLSGDYSIDAVNYYGNYTNTKTVEFSVVSAMSAEIQVDEEEVFENNNIHFKAVFTGAVGNVNMIWKMDDGTEKYVPEFDYAYPNAREYNVVLLATDQGGNQIVMTKKILVNRQYFLKVKVLDNQSSEVLINATVRLDSDSHKTNSTGETEFKVTNTTYELRVSAENYFSYSDDLSINNSYIFTVKLVKDDEAEPPIVTLLSPANNTRIQSPEFKYKFADVGSSDCSLFISEGEGWWEDVNRSTDLSPNTEYSFYPDLENKTYNWRVQCTDDDGNTGYSQNYYVNISGAPAQIVTEDTVDTTFTVIQDVYDQIPDFNSYSPDEKKIADYLNLDALVKDATRKLDMANRDIYNLKYQPDTDSIIKARDEIYSRIDQIKDSTPQSVTLNNKVEFVNYIADSDIGPLVDEYVKLKEIELNSGDLKRLTEQITLLQKKATIGTAAYNVQITYISGRTEEITLIVRNIENSFPSENYYFVEFVPKELIETSDDIVFVTKPSTILNKDPAFEYALSQVKEVVYYINQSVSLDSIPKIKPVILTTNLESGSGSQITGFAVFDNMGLSGSNKFVFMAEILVVLALAGTYVYYSRKSSQNELKPLVVKKEYLVQKMSQNQRENAFSASHQMIASTDQHKVDYIRIVLQKAKETLKENNLEQVALKYYEIRFLYNLLDDNSKNLLFPDVISLADELNYRYITKILDRAIIDLALGNYDSALSQYTQIQDEFNKLSEDYQESIYPRCCELALHLKELKTEENEIKQ